MRAAQIYDAIVAAHQPPEWAVLAEVGDATGGRASRRADAVALNLWPSRGLEIRGFEIKVSRSDLRREFEDPSKADAVGAYCHTWCLATPVGLVKTGDPIPAVWGLFEVGEDGAGRFKRLPTSRPASDVKEPTRLFMAAIARAAAAEVSQMRRGGEWIRREEIQDKLDAAFKNGHDSAPRDDERERSALAKKLDLANPILAELGIDLNAGYQGISPSRHLLALKIGHALIQRWGDQSAARITKQISDALEDLTRAKNAIAELLAKVDDEDAA